MVPMSFLTSNLRGYLQHGRRIDKNIRINSWTATWVQDEKPMDLKIFKDFQVSQILTDACFAGICSHVSWRWICWSATSRWAGITRVWRGLAEDFLFGSRSSRLQVEHARPYLALSTIRMNPPKSMFSETKMLGAGKQDAIWKMFQHARRCRCEHAMAPGKARMLCSLIRTRRCINISPEPSWNTLWFGHIMHKSYTYTFIDISTSPDIIV